MIGKMEKVEVMGKILKAEKLKNFISKNARNFCE